MRIVVLLFLVLYVLPAEAQLDYFIEARVSNDAPFVGQQITYSFRLYSRVSRTNRGSIVDPAFDGFWKREFDTIRQFTEAVDGQFYEVKERSFALYPAYAGEIVIEPSAFVLASEPGWSGEVLTTDPLLVRVQPLPVQADVIGFDGAVGQLELQPTVDRQVTKVGEPVTLRLLVQGTGNIEMLPAPRLPESDVWRVYANPSRYRVQNLEGVVVGEKVFEWLLTPQTAGQQPLPIITMSYFDPNTLTYQSIATTAINVEVLATVESDADIVAVVNVGPLPLKALPASLTVSSFDLSFVGWLLWLVPPCLFVWVWRRQRQHDERRRNMARYRRSEALAKAQKTLASARRGESEKIYHIVRVCVVTYFADKLNVDAATLQPQEIGEAMASYGLDERLQAQVFVCLAAVDEALYAPFPAADSDMLASNCAKLLAAVDARWHNA